MCVCCDGLLISVNLTCLVEFIRREAKSPGSPLMSQSGFRTKWFLQLNIRRGWLVTVEVDRGWECEPPAHPSPYWDPSSHSRQLLQTGVFHKDAVIFPLEFKYLYNNSDIQIKRGKWMFSPNLPLSTDTADEWKCQSCRTSVQACNQWCHQDLTEQFQLEWRKMVMIKSESESNE